MGVGDTRGSCLLMMLIILFLILCQNLKHKSWTLKGSKRRGARRGQTIYAPGSMRVCAHGCTHIKSYLLLPTVILHIVYLCPDHSGASGPKAALHLPRRAGRLRVQSGPWAPGYQTLCCQSVGSRAGEHRQASPLPLPAGAGHLQPLHLRTRPSPL